MAIRKLFFLGVVATSCIFTWKVIFISLQGRHLIETSQSSSLDHKVKVYKRFHSPPPTDHGIIQFSEMDYNAFVFEMCEHKAIDLPSRRNDQCPCVFDIMTATRGGYNGWIPITSSDNYTHWKEMELEHTGLQLGGTWSPQTCRARHHVAIIIPFRDREYHLRIFVSVMHTLLQRQKLKYTIFIVEQAGQQVFNKATLMNIGFKEVRKLTDVDCFIFHDVDILPEDDRNFYICGYHPRHVGAYVDQWNYTIGYSTIFGGATAFTAEQFQKANGFSNSFYGWGGEDDDMFKRVVNAGMNVIRYPESVAKYHAMQHERDKGNPVNPKSSVGFHTRLNEYKLNGLNSLKYKIKSIEFLPLYTRIYAEVPKRKT